jgi:hypothetical protein
MRLSHANPLFTDLCIFLLVLDRLGSERHRMQSRTTLSSVLCVHRLGGWLNSGQHFKSGVHSASAGSESGSATTGWSINSGIQQTQWQSLCRAMQQPLRRCRLRHVWMVDCKWSSSLMLETSSSHNRTNGTHLLVVYPDQSSKNKHAIGIDGK